MRLFAFAPPTRVCLSTIHAAGLGLRGRNRARLGTYGKYPNFQYLHAVFTVHDYQTPAKLRNFLKRRKIQYFSLFHLLQTG